MPKICKRSFLSRLFVLVGPLLFMGHLTSCQHFSSPSSKPKGAGGKTAKAKSRVDLEQAVANLSQDKEIKKSSLDLAKTIKNPNKAGGMEEALVALAVLQTFNTSKEKTPNLLENLAKEANLNLISALATNMHLKNVAVQKLVLRVVENSSAERGEFKDQLISQLEKTNQELNSLSERLAHLKGPQATEAQPEETAPPEEEEAPEAVTPPSDPSGSLPYGNWEFRDDEEVLDRARDFLAQSKFKEAVEILRLVKEGNIYYSAAQDKLREACNLAVQDLRQNAAKAFQNSLPVTEPKARQSYLKEAEQLLQQALDLYPEADQIATVQQNLKVIQKNLETLESSVGTL